jgi:F0F1-type ATP synthase gamma subunit
MEYLILEPMGSVYVLDEIKFIVSMVFQVAVLADDILKNVEYDAIRVVFNKFQSVISFQPTMATILSPEVSPCS